MTKSDALYDNARSPKTKQKPKGKQEAKKGDVVKLGPQGDEYESMGTADEMKKEGLTPKDTDESGASPTDPPDQQKLEYWRKRQKPAVPTS